MLFILCLIPSRTESPEINVDHTDDQNIGFVTVKVEVILLISNLKGSLTLYSCFRQTQHSSPTWLDDPMAESRPEGMPLVDKP